MCCHVFVLQLCPGDEVWQLAIWLAGSRKLISIKGLGRPFPGDPSGCSRNKEQIVCDQEAKTETPAGRSFLISREWVLEHLTCARVTLGYGHAAWWIVPGVPHAGEQRRRCSDLGWEGKVSEFGADNVGHLASNQTKGKRWVWSSGRAWFKVQQNGTQIPCLLLPNLEPLKNYT